MRFDLVALALAASALMLTAQGCGAGATPIPTAAVATQRPVSSAAPTATETATATPFISVACQNPLYPIVEGATWQYVGHDSINGDFTFDRTFSEIHADGFTEQDLWSSGLTRTARWTCENGNLKALDLGTSAGTVSTTNMQLVADSVVSDGKMLPAMINVGDTWAETLDISGHVVLSASSSAPSRNQATITCTATGNESVTVAAGTFDAVKIDCQVGMLVTVTLVGLDLSPTQVNSTASAWYAPGVGLVKTESTSDMESYAFELGSYDIP